MRVTLNTTVLTEVPASTLRHALLDFSERRLVYWPRLDPATYVVHAVGETSADVTQGSRFPRMWSREHFDWSHETTIVWTATESNFVAPASFIAVDILRVDGDGSRVEVTWDRRSANVRGWLVLAVVRLGGNRLLRWATQRSLVRVAHAYDGSDSPDA